MIENFNVLGVRISALNMALAISELQRLIAARSGCQYVCVTGMHGVIESQDESEIRAIHNKAALVTPDGMPLVWLGRMSGHAHVGRVYGPDLMLEMCQRGYRHFFYGGKDGVPEKLAGVLSSRFPNMQVAGVYSPPFRALTQQEQLAIVEAINRSQADIVWVGLGTPKQERWMAGMAVNIKSPLLIGVGAAFDFHAGTISQAPVWMRKSGFEWLFRLMMEPRRLARRYLLNIPRFMWLVGLQRAGVRRNNWIVE